MTALLGWAATMAALLAALHGMPVPATEPAVAGAAFAAVRLVALALGWYLVVVGAAGFLARSVRWGRAVRIADALSLPAVRAVLDRAVGATLVAALVVSVPAADAFISPRPAAAEAPVPSPSEPPVMRRLPDEPAPATGAPAPPPRVLPATWTVAPGENFWVVAERVLADTRGRDVSDAEVLPYWHRLIEHNVERLRVPSEPGLLFVGQELVLPPV